MHIKLYYTPRTRALRPRWLLEELQIPYELHNIDLFGGAGRSPEYRRIHPHGSVPAVEIDGEPMIESGAICHWLSDRFPEKKLAPAFDDPQRRRYEQWMFYVPGTLEPLPFTILLHGSILPEAQRVPDIVRWASKQYLSTLKILEHELSDKPYLLGDSFSTADIMAGSTLMWLPDMLRNYPSLQAYTERLQTRDAYQRANNDQ
jgi:glutathione S-transferase